jgi:hypothetical protein
MTLQGVFRTIPSDRDPLWFMKPEEVAALQAKGGAAAVAPSGSFGIGKGGLDVPAALFWLFVAIPLGWGVYKTLISAIKIF